VLAKLTHHSIPVIKRKLIYSRVGSRKPQATFVSHKASFNKQYTATTSVQCLISDKTPALLSYSTFEAPGFIGTNVNYQALYLELSGGMNSNKKRF
jgi:hypothetical protein